VPLTGYQQYLQELRQTLPVINANVIRDTEGTFFGKEDSEYTQYEELLNQYQMLQYNHLVDSKHRLSGFFGDES
jgi:hypothetical protein